MDQCAVRGDLYHKDTNTNGSLTPLKGIDKSESIYQGEDDQGRLGFCTNISIADGKYNHWHLTGAALTALGLTEMQDRAGVVIGIKANRKPVENNTKLYAVHRDHKSRFNIGLSFRTRASIRETCGGRGGEKPEDYHKRSVPRLIPHLSERYTNNPLIRLAQQHSQKLLWLPHPKLPERG